MAKLFFDVFPTLKLNERTRTLFADVEVTKVATNRDRDYLHVYLFSTHLIQKPQICDMEIAIKEQLFGMNPIRIAIKESFQLSSQYTPENLLREYYESILYELKNRSIVEHNMFASANCSFENGRMLRMKFEDSIVAEKKAEAIEEYLLDVFHNRCNVPVEIHTDFERVRQSKMQEQNALRLQQEVNAIVDEHKAKKKEVREEKEAKAAERKNEKEQKAAQFAAKRAEYQRAQKKEADPNLVYGRDFEDEPIELKNVLGEMGEIVFRGKVLTAETREIRNEKSIYSFAVTDFTDTIMVKMFLRNEQLPEILGEIKPGAFLKIKGVTTIDRFDNELTIGSIFGVKKIPDFTVKRKDTYPEKRVELHCHSKMSDMDGVTDVATLCKCAHGWGHKALAITDHGVVQAFPDANHFIERIDKDDPFKVIYGVEAYLVDDLTEIVVNVKDQTLDSSYVVFDIETTGFSEIEDRIIEIGAVKVENGEITDRFSAFVNPEIPIPFEIINLTGITDEMVMEANTIEKVLPEFLAFCEGSVLVAHNAGFDVGFIKQKAKKVMLKCL